MTLFGGTENNHENLRINVGVLALWKEVKCDAA
jgi:hypothetical protein